MGACSEPPTDYLLHVDSRMNGDPLHSIRGRTWATDDTTQADVIESSFFCVGGTCRTLPVTIALVPTSDLSRRYQVEVIGYSDEGCANQLVSQLAKLEFVPHTSLDAYMDLTNNCVNVMCPAGQTDGGLVVVDMATTDKVRYQCP